MPDVRMPDGTIIRNVPEGTTKSQLLAMTQKQQKIEQVAKPYSDSQVALSSVVKGLASIPDAVLNTPSNLINLGKAAVGTVLNESGQGDLSQKLGFNDVSEPPSPITTAIRNNIGLYEPKTSGQRVLDWTVQGLSGAALVPSQSASNVAKNLALGASSGAVGGVTTEVTDNPIAGILAATLATPAMMAGAKVAKNNFPQTWTKKGRELDVANFLNKNVKDPIAAVGQLKALPEKPLVPSPDKVSGQPLPQNAAPASKPTTAQILAQNGDTQLIGVEKALGEASGIEKDLINARYDANAQARQAQMERMIPVPRDAGVDAVQNTVRSEVGRQEQIRNKQQQQAQDAATDARIKTGDNITPEQAGNVFLSEFDKLYAAKKAETKTGFQVDPFNEVQNLTINKTAIASTLDDFYAGLKKPIPASVKQALAMIDEATGANISKTVEDGQPPKIEPPKQSRTDIDPSRDDLLAAISKYGGMSRESALKFGVDPAILNQRTVFGKPIFPAKGGLDPDSLAELLSQHGYPVLDGGSYSANIFLNSLDDALRGNKVYAPQAYEKGGAADFSLELQSRGRNTDPLDDDFIAGFDDAPPKLEVMNYKQMQAVASAIGKLQREAAGTPGLEQDAAVLGKLKDVVRDSMNEQIAANKVPDDIANRYQQGLKSRIEQAKQFESGASGDMRQFNGERNVKAKDLPKTMLQSGGENLASFNRSLGGSDKAKQAASDYLAQQWRDVVTNPSNGTVKKDWRNQSSKFLRDYDYVLRDYPELKTKLDLAVKRSASAEDLAARFDTEMQVLKKETGARFFLKDADPAVSLDSFLKSKNRRQDGKYILALAKNNPDFRQSMNAAIRDHMMNLKNDQQRVAFIDDVQNQRLIKGLFGEKMLIQWQKITADAKRDLLRQTKNVSRGSDTANKFEGLRLAGRLASSSKWAQLYEAMAQYAGTKARDTLRAEALLEPQKAASLLEQKANMPTFKDNFKESNKVTTPQLFQFENKGNEEYIDKDGNVYIRKKKD